VNDPTDVLGRRVGAGLVDLLVAFIIFLGLGAALGGATDEGSRVGVQVQGLDAVLVFGVILLYHGALEALTGQTIGKRVFGLRVVRADGGGKPGTGQIALRTILRLVDGLGAYLLGLVVVIATGKRRARLGDLAGRTAVVRA
jgi:uncharacterized RDD family membrane protein YckC